MTKEEKLKDLCNNCVVKSQYCETMRCNQYEKLAKEENDPFYDLYISSDEKDTFVKRFETNNLVPMKDFIEHFLDDSKIEYEKLCFYRNDENTSEIIVSYGGLMYFVIKEVFENADVSSII